MSWKQEFNSDVNDVRWGAFQIFWKLVLPVILLISFCGFIGRVACQPAAIVEKTMDADNVLYNYEYFKQAYQDIHAMDQKIKVAQGDLAAFNSTTGTRNAMDREDKIEQSRLTAIVSGLKNQRASQVAEYNARAQMTNRSIFKSHNLPDSL